MRLIDAEWLLDLYQGLEGLDTPINAVVQNIKDAPTINAAKVVQLRDLTDEELEHYKALLNKNARTITNVFSNADAVEVVRCRDCKWLKKWDDGEQTCRRIGVGYIVGDDDYCSFGERRCGK